MEPNAVTWALLGLLAQGRAAATTSSASSTARSAISGRRATARSTPSCAASRRSAGSRATTSPNGGRARREYRITTAGRQALDGWFAGIETRMELRDESLLRLFFADDAAGRARARAAARRRRTGTARCSSTCAASTTAAASPTRRSSTSSTGGGSSTASGASRWCDRQHGRRLQRGGLNELPEPTWRLLLGRGLPHFALEALLPILAFYAVLAARRGSAPASSPAPPPRSCSPDPACSAGRDVALAALGAVFVVIQAVVALATHSATVYLAQPSCSATLLGIAYFVSVAVGRPLVGVFASAWYPFPDWFGRAPLYRREFGFSPSSGPALLPSRAGLRLVALLHSGVGGFLVVSFLTGTAVRRAGALGRLARAAGVLRAAGRAAGSVSTARRGRPWCPRSSRSASQQPSDSGLSAFSAALRDVSVQTPSATPVRWQHGRWRATGPTGAAPPLAAFAARKTCGEGTAGGRSPDGPARA